MTTRVVKCINKKHKLFIKYNRGQITYEAFSIYCEGLKLLLFIVENNCHLKELKGKNKKRKWKYLNKMMGRTYVTSEIELKDNNNIQITDKKTIANIINKHFNEIPTEIHNTLSPPTQTYLSHIPINEHSLFLVPTISNEVEQIIKKLKN